MSLKLLRPMLGLLSSLITAVFAGWLMYMLGMTVFQSVVIGFCTLGVSLLLRILGVVEGILQHLNTKNP